MRAATQSARQGKAPLLVAQRTREPANKEEKRQKHGLFAIGETRLASGGARGGAQTAPGPKHTEKKRRATVSATFFFLSYSTTEQGRQQQATQ